MADMRNIFLLSGAQAIAGSAQGLVIAVGALAAAALAIDPSLATVPITAMIIGVAVAAGPAALILHRLGRTRGFLLGSSISICGGLLAALALYLDNFLLFCAALALIGVSGAFGQQYRFAVADSVAPELKARAVSWVMFGGVLAGFLGPRLASITSEAIEGAPFAGSFISLAVLGLIGASLIAFTRLPRGEKSPASKAGRPVGELLRAPDVFVPIITGAASYALMTFVMVAAPLAMVYLCGHTTGEAASAIQWHIVAMFAPSFITGAIIGRIGTHLTVAIGLVLILGCALVSLNGTTTLHFDIGLVLLGVGWNFGFIGSTVMLTTSYRAEEAGRVQALNEQIVFGVMALASIGAGVVLNLVGWEAINMAVLPVVSAGLILLAWADFRARRLRRAVSSD